LIGLQYQEHFVASHRSPAFFSVFITGDKFDFRHRLSYIATTVNGREHVVLVDDKVVAGPFATVAEAIKAREALVREVG
jgi:hypothetical protein